MRRIIETGNTYGRLKVVALSHIDGECFWKCKCSCGKTTISSGDKLRSGRKTSCGCYHSERLREQNKTHGMSKTKIYMAWNSIKHRCLNPLDKRYIHYGGRGIGICDRWLKFENFLSDMGERPKGKTLDRIDNDKGYSPENCRWATWQEQMLNTRRQRIENFSDEQIMQEVARRLRERKGELFARYNTLHFGSAGERIG